MTLIRTVPLVLVLSIACTSTPGPGAFPPCEAETIVSIGDPLPDCTFEGVGDDPPIALADLKGSPVVLNFWASWCVACIKEMPDFEEVHLDLGREVRFIGMNTLGVLGEVRSEAERFALSTGVTYRLAYDQSGLLYGHFGELLRPVMPLTVFVDEEGIVRGRHFGQISAETLRQLIAQDLGVG